MEGDGAMSWYLRKEWVDQEDGIESVLLHYTCTPLDAWPDWERFRNTRVLVDQGGFPRRHEKVISMPESVYDEARGWHPEYRLHHYFEVFQHGRQWSTDLFTEEIACRDLEFTDDAGLVTNICIYWSVGDWGAPVYSPMEDPRFPADSEFTAKRYYNYWDRDRYHASKFHMLQAIPLPHRWQGRMWAPRGATVVQQYHVGRTYPEQERFETWLGPDGPSEPAGSSWVHQL
jgi:hypothetical protein